MSRNSAEAFLVQSVAGGCLTLNSAMRFNETRERGRLQENLRARQVQPRVPPGVGDGDVNCTVSARSEDERHAVYETLRRMAAAAGQGEAGQAQHGPPATRTLVVVLDTVAAAAGPPAPPRAGGAAAAGAARPAGGLRAVPPGFAGPASAASASCDPDVAPLGGPNRSTCIRAVVRVEAGRCWLSSGSSVCENAARQDAGPGVARICT